MMSQTSLKQLSTGLARIVMLLAIGVYFLPLSAQNPELPEPIYPLFIPRDMYWSSDSHALVFHDVTFYPEQQPWLVYNIITQTLTEYDERPVRTFKYPCGELSEATLDQISPSGQYLAFTEAVTSNDRESGSGIAHLGIANCAGDESRVFQDFTGEGGRILWSEDETAFLHIAMINPPVEQRMEYVGNFRRKVENAILRNLRAIPIEDTIFSAYAAYDLSSDGQRVLLKIYDNPNRINSLYIYDTRYPLKSRLLQVDATQVVTAQFAPEDETKLWMFNERGVVEYDLVTEEVILIGDEVKAADLPDIFVAEPSIFSPDGRYLATLGPQGLYIIDLTEEAARLATGTPAPLSTGESDALRRLWLTVDCPAEPVASLTWTVHNPNMEAVSVTWVSDFRPEAEGNPLVIPGGSEDSPGVATFATAVESGTAQQIRILVDGVFHDTLGCFVPRAG